MKVSINSIKELTKDTNSNTLHKRRHKANAQCKSHTRRRVQSQYSSTLEGAQSKLEVTILGDYKDHKQKNLTIQDPKGWILQ